ncbi:lysophospholipid acyltransferase family protein [Cupriavidus malaysiensis]|uniref:1-acyl-sn-glycerol-3-phosphate acyltransferase n=1 Tax=Cupriavidus malaysiensis TaxID=367825 RepID=A0ABM6F701_9BURK|nr:lysophospholipid acyltransferase family protein [Cupriavidus malaysiensis]AOZ07347.1 1-acyl-sn-glycerol-3-phosphate acyltransferase [Cupriavidus malaysiensis]
MVWLRKLGLVLHLVRGALTCALLFPWLGPAARQWHIRRWSRRLLRLCGITVELQGEPPATGAGHGAMVVCNHISWLDIYVINCWQPVRFVAKSEIRSWPLIGWLCQQTGTIFIERGRKRDAHRVLHDITGVMRQGDLVCVFPEGTTSDGSSVLPFHANLMQAPLSAGLPVQPLGLAYLDGATRQPTLAPAYIGDLSLLQCLNAVLSAPPIVARLSFAPALHAASASRRELGEAAREVVMHLTQGAHEQAHGVAARVNGMTAAGTTPDGEAVPAPAR